MPDIIDADGLQVKTANEITEELETGLKDIYGADINLDQNSSDGQMVGIITQIAVDQRELAVSVNNSFDPDQALGRLLDQRVVINNIERAGGTYTITPIDITVDRTVDLQGLDLSANDVNGTGFTVQDDSGNQFILIDSVTITAGVHSLDFRSKIIGAVETVVGTIVNPVTIVLGVTSIINNDPPLSLGQKQETDAQLRVRRQQSVALASTGYLNGMLGDILDLEGVTDARLYENYTDTIDANGIPAHATWLVVEGGSASDIGNVYYQDKSYGSNMKGAETFDITTASGQIFTAKFDRPIGEDLYIRFNLKRTVPSFIFNEAEIKQSLVDLIAFKIGQYAETSTLTADAILAIAENGGGGVPLDVEISDDGVAWTDYLVTPTLQSKWTTDVSRVTITVIA